MADPKQVNIGTPERPIFVPQKALRPESAEGREWWGMVAEGSVVLEKRVLDKLVEKPNEKKS